MATNETTTLGSGWDARFLAAAKLLHQLLSNQGGSAIMPKIGSSAVVLAQLLNDVILGKYSPERYFERGEEAPAVKVVRQAPTLDEDFEYMLVALNASTPTGQFVSVQEGGVVFEDPVWMVLVAHVMIDSVATLGVPLAQTNDELWVNAAAAEDAVAAGTYRPENFLGPIAGFLPRDAKPRFKLIRVNFAQITGLRERGMHSFGDGKSGPRFYQLFGRPTKM